MYETEEFLECPGCNRLLFPGDLVVEVEGIGEVCPDCEDDLVALRTKIRYP